MSSIYILPQITVTVDEKLLSEESADALTGVRVQQRLSLPTLCELTFFYPQGSPHDNSMIRIGSEFTVSVTGFQPALFSGHVTAFEYSYEPSHGQEVRVRGFDLLYRLRKRQNVRAYVQVDLADLARELATEFGISVRSHASGPLWQRLIQHTQSDFDLLSETAARSGLFFTLRDNCLHIFTLEGIGESASLALGKSLLEARLEVNEDAACRSVSAAAWNPLRVNQHVGKANKARLGRDVALRLPDSPQKSERILVNEIVQDHRQAEAIAQAQLDVCAAREVTLSGVAEGNPILRPGTPVEIQGLAAPFAGKYVLTSVNHIIDAEKGFISELSTSPPSFCTRSPGPATALGIVTGVEDPEGMGRVQVSLPAYANVETEWMEVLAPMAGAGKGLVALPDIGDQVLVLFERGDPTQGVILGCLYGTKAPPDWGVEEKGIRRFAFFTPGGQRAQFDDKRQTIRLENSEGSFIEMAPKKVLMHSKANMEIEAPGRTIVIRGKAIDFEKG